MDETIVWQCDTDNYTPLTTAQEFARRGFSEPREVGIMTHGRNTTTFRLKDGGGDVCGASCERRAPRAARRISDCAIG